MHRIFLITLLVCAAGLVAAMTAWAQPVKEAPAQAPAVVWEYKTIPEQTYSYALETTFNAAGAESWELVTANDMTTVQGLPRTVFTFKRPKVAGR